MTKDADDDRFGTGSAWIAAEGRLAFVNNRRSATKHLNSTFEPASRLLCSCLPLVMLLSSDAEQDSKALLFQHPEACYLGNSDI